MRIHTGYIQHDNEGPVEEDVNREEEEQEKWRRRKQYSMVVVVSMPPQRNICTEGRGTKAKDGGPDLSIVCVL